MQDCYERSVILCDSARFIELTAQVGTAEATVAQLAELPGTQGDDVVPGPPLELPPEPPPGNVVGVGVG
jgi:hypothetical protein